MIEQMTEAWYQVKRPKSKKHLPSIHKTGLNEKGKMHTMCGIRVIEATHIADLSDFAFQVCERCDK